VTSSWSIFIQVLTVFTVKRRYTESPNTLWRHHNRVVMTSGEIQNPDVQKLNHTCKFWQPLF